MLKSVQTEKAKRKVFRLSRVIDEDRQFFNDMNLDINDQKEVASLINEKLLKIPQEELLDLPFRSSQRKRYRSRFSDGTFPVFYSALEEETAKAEVSYLFKKKFVGNPQENRTAYYQIFSCAFNGLEKDLRNKEADWPDLKHDNDYSFRNKLGKEVLKLKIGGLVVPSARHIGSNLPIFTRRAVNGVKLRGVMKVTFLYDSGDVCIEDLR